MLAVCQTLTKKAGSGSGSVSQWYGSSVRDPYQNVADPQHWVKAVKNARQRQCIFETRSKVPHEVPVNFFRINHGKIINNLIFESEKSALGILSLF